MASKKTALVLGATGLVGSELVNLLIQDSRYSQIFVLIRQPLVSLCDTQNKVQCVRLAPDDPMHPWNDYKTLFDVDHVYICLGTTLKKAGSRTAFKLVDYHYVLQAAQIAAMQQVASLVYISSVDADIHSRSFYLQIKGQLEHDIANIPGGLRAHAARPSLLIGKRSEFRLAERVGIVLARLLSFLLVGRLRKYRPIKASEVARQMIQMQHFN